MKYIILITLFVFAICNSNVTSVNWKYLYNDRVFSLTIEKPSENILKDKITVKLKNNTNFTWKLWNGNWGCANLLFVWVPEPLAKSLIAKYDTIRPLGLHCIGWEFEEHNPGTSSMVAYSEISINKYLVNDSWSIGNLFLKDTLFDKIAIKAIYMNGPIKNSSGFDYRTYFLGRIPSSFGQWKPYANSYMWKGSVESDMIVLRVNRNETFTDRCIGAYNVSIDCREIYPIGFVPYKKNEAIKALLNHERLSFRNNREGANKVSDKESEKKFTRTLRLLKSLPQK